MMGFSLVCLYIDAWLDGEGCGGVTRRATRRAVGRRDALSDALWGGGISCFDGPSQEAVHSAQEAGGRWPQTG